MAHISTPPRNASIPFAIRGEAVFYLASDGLKKAATIVKLHTDDVDPYYTIKVDGQERGTVRARLSRADGGGGGALGASDGFGALPPFPPSSAFPPASEGSGWVDFGTPFEPLPPAETPPPSSGGGFGVSSKPLEGFGSDFGSAGFGGSDFGSSSFSGEGNGAAAETAAEAPPPPPVLSKEEEMKKRVEKYRGLSTEEKRAKIREELAAEQKAKREAGARRETRTCVGERRRARTFGGGCTLGNGSEGARWEMAARVHVCWISSERPIAGDDRAAPFRPNVFAAEKARKEAAEKAKAEREAKAKAEAEDRARKEAEKKAREEEVRAQVRAKIAAEKKAKADAEQREREEKVDLPLSPLMRRS